MKRFFLLILVILAILPIVTAVGSLIGTSCDVNSDSLMAREECAQETKYLSWANVISDSCKFVMDSVRESSVGYKNLKEPESELKDIKNKITVIS